MIEIGIDSFAAAVTDPESGERTAPAERLNQLVEEVVTADEAGLTSFGIGEHHRRDNFDSAPVVILAAAAARTSRIRLTSAVTVLSADDPVRVFQQFATLDLLSRGRAEIVAGRGSSIEAYPLFGLDLADYDALFSEKLNLLLELREHVNVHWQGQFRPPLTGQGVYPRPAQNPLPVWVGVGGTPASFVRAGALGLPLMVAVIGGNFQRFRPLVDLYREAGVAAGHPPETLRVGVHAFGYVADTDEDASNDFWPGYEWMMGQIGRERGWPEPTRSAFDAARRPGGPYLIGDPAAVAEKVAFVDRTLGGIQRLTFQMTNAMLPHDKMLAAIRRLGAEVVPRVRTLTEDAPR